MSYSDSASLLTLATGSVLLGFIARSFPVFRLWLGLIPIAIIALALLAWGLLPQLREYARWNSQRVGQFRAHGPAFWTAHRIALALGPFVIFSLLVTLGGLLG